MKTTVIESSKSNGKANGTAVTVKADNSKTEQQKVNVLPTSNEFNNRAKAKTEPTKEEITAKVAYQEPQAPKVETERPQEQVKAEIQKVETELANAEPTKKEVKEEPRQKPTLNLESTLKLVEELHRRKIQRDRLLDTIDALEAFEIEQQESAEETDSNHFQGCVLTIEDDNRKKFTTKNPVIIKAVAQFVNNMCVNRLAEIEADIVIPAY
ncbi:flagellar biosynthesis GTPase FlhF [Pedobacter sp. UYP30]|uniref:hypothetical protein n=1 Tax=Pedobacter sp. UYP30 TaxID=1756400 RepID=UPI00339634C6